MTSAAPPECYVPRRASRSRFVEIRGLRYHVREWGSEDAQPLLLLHGAVDCSATFQFLADAMEGEWHIFAPDWRGHGQSEWASQGYWFQDYIGDLDALMHRLFDGGPVPVAGHSLGGNVALMYAGVEPARVSRLISLDGFGLPDRDPSEAPARLARWLQSWREPRTARVFADVEAMAARLMEVNPRLDLAKARFLAANLSHRDGEGYTWAFDPRHRAPFAVPHRKAEWTACAAQVKAPALFIGSGAVFPPMLADEAGGLEARVAAVPGAAYVRVEDTGHNLHHDAPEAVARLVEDFLAAGVPASRS